MGETTIPFTNWFPSGEAQLWTDNLPVSPSVLILQSELTIAHNWKPPINPTSK
jgi:hypothetical protein